MKDRMAASDTQSRPSMLKDLLLSFRPVQWTKNIVVAVAFFFAYWDKAHTASIGLEALWTVIPAFACFCMLSSAVYLMNDIMDVETDRNHPEKKFRPIAAGRISTTLAASVAFLLLAGALGGAWYLSKAFAVVAGAYAVMQVFYTLWLKRIALVDVFVLAAGFVLRAVAGAEVMPGVTISPWLLLCTFLLALFLALCKRRHEKVVIASTSNLSRPSLGQYDKALLDQLIGISACATIVCYAMYTLSPETSRKFGTPALGFTIPFVIFGIFRYLDLVYRHESGGRPEKILVTDAPMIVNMLLYGMTILGIFLLTR